MDQILAEYKVKARQFHPDKNVDKQEATDDEFKLLQEAKNTLTDPEMRAAYDKW